MPDVILYFIIFILTLIAIGTLIGFFTEECHGSIPAILLPISILLISWIIYSASLPVEYIKSIDATVSHNTINNQIHCSIEFENLSGRLEYYSIGYVPLDTKVKVSLPKKTYFGIYYVEPIKPKIEVIENVEIQSSEHEVEETLKSERATGLLD